MPAERNTRQTPSSSRTYAKECIFCEKETKYQKGTKSREPLIQCCDLRADDAIRATAIASRDSRVIGIVSRKLVATEACYHRSCYRNYTRPKKTTLDPSPENDVSSEDVDSYSYIESQGYQKVFKFFRLDLFENPRLITLMELRELLLAYM